MSYNAKLISNKLNASFTTGSIVYRRVERYTSEEGAKIVWNILPKVVAMQINARLGLHKKGTYVGNLQDKFTRLIQVDIVDGRLTFLHGCYEVNDVLYSYHEEDKLEEMIGLVDDFLSSTLGESIFLEDMAGLSVEAKLEIYWSDSIKKPWHLPGGDDAFNPHKQKKVSKRQEFLQRPGVTNVYLCLLGGYFTNGQFHNDVGGVMCFGDIEAGKKFEHDHMLGGIGIEVWVDLANKQCLANFSWAEGEQGEVHIENVKKQKQLCLETAEHKIILKK